MSPGAVNSIFIMGLEPYFLHQNEPGAVYFIFQMTLVHIKLEDGRSKLICKVIRSKRTINYPLMSSLCLVNC